QRAAVKERPGTGRTDPRLTARRGDTMRHMLRRALNSRAGRLAPLALLVFAAALSSPVAGQEAFATPERLRAADAIDADGLRAVVAEIASDRYEGRAPGTAGDAMTQAYLAAALERLGFEPAGPDGTWLQPFDLVGISAAQPPAWTFARDGERLELAQGT